MNPYPVPQHHRNRMGSEQLTQNHQVSPAPNYPRRPTALGLAECLYVWCRSHGNIVAPPVLVACNDWNERAENEWWWCGWARQTQPTEPIEKFIKSAIYSDLKCMGERFPLNWKYKQTPTMSCLLMISYLVVGFGLCVAIAHINILLVLSLL